MKNPYKYLIAVKHAPTKPAQLFGFKTKYDADCFCKAMTKAKLKWAFAKAPKYEKTKTTH